MGATEAKMLAAVTLSSLKKQRSDVHFIRIGKSQLQRLMNLIVKSQYYHAKRKHKSALIKPAVVLILMQHQKLCIVDTILKSQTHLFGKTHCRFESPSFNFYAKMESVLRNQLLEKTYVWKTSKIMYSISKIIWRNLSC